MCAVNFLVSAVCAQLGSYVDSLIGFYFQASWLGSDGLVRNEHSEGAVNVGGHDVFSNGTVNVLSSAVSGLLALGLGSIHARQ